MLSSYVAGRLKIITNADTKGLNTFVGTFALPSLIFTSLVALDWNTVNWIFLLAILISKCIVFFAVGIVSLLMTRPLNFGRAGILAIFCTQSNDFAIGFPIVNALYHHAHPEYASYLYLMAPLSLAILNPIGYIFLELSSVKKTPNPSNQVNLLRHSRKKIDRLLTLKRINRWKTQMGYRMNWIKRDQVGKHWYLRHWNQSFSIRSCLWPCLVLSAVLSWDNYHQ